MFVAHVQQRSCVLLQVVYKPQQAIAEYVVTYEAQAGVAALPATDEDGNEASAPAQLIGGAFTATPAEPQAQVRQAVRDVLAEANSTTVLDDLTTRKVQSPNQCSVNLNWVRIGA